MDHNDGTIDPYDAAVARELELRRRILGLDVKELAGIVGIPWRTLYRYLKGERAIPVSKVAAISRGLGIKPGDVIEAAERAVPQPEQKSRVDSGDA